MSALICGSPLEAAAFLANASGYTVAFEFDRKGAICHNALLFDSDRPDWFGLLPVSSIPLIAHLFGPKMLGEIDRMVAQYQAEQAGMRGRA